MLRKPDRQLACYAIKYVCVTQSMFYACSKMSASCHSCCSRSLICFALFMEASLANVLVGNELELNSRNISAVQLVRTWGHFRTDISILLGRLLCSIIFHYTRAVAREFTH